MPICVFGNRSPDEAPRGLALLLEQNGFRVAGAAAFACRHAFSDRVGTGRPDEADRREITDFVCRVVGKLALPGELPELEMDRSEIGLYYIPLKADGTLAKFLKAKPVTDWERCAHCGLCAKSCPMESINPDTMETTGICVKCQACQAKHLEDADVLSHIAMLEKNYSRRAENIVLL